MLRYKTRRGSDPKGKPRVLFISHPDDFEQCFPKIAEDILAEADVAIWFDDEPERSVADDDELFELISDMQLAVVAVTDKLIRSESRALSEEIPFIFDRRIPILPIAVGDIDLLRYEKVFGGLQYLERSERDSTAIPYREKLKKHLSANLLSDEITEKVRAAFDAYIFLSYRKKDRKHAQELMRLIHSNEFCRDVAIWYDEYLTPGENFNDSIVAAFEKSDLFVMAVTPNLVNEKNYVESTEYPMATRAGKPIIPIEMVPTDRAELDKKYADIPSPFDRGNTDGISEELKRTLAGSLKSIALSENDEDPEHLFFIGLAYLYGIDVEKDQDRGVKLIRRAANKNLPEASEKLSLMYYTGDGVERNTDEALKWNARLPHAYYQSMDKYPKGVGYELIHRSKMERARMYEEEGQYDAALYFYKCHFGLYTDMEPIPRYVKMSELCFKSKNKKAAIKYMKKAIGKSSYIGAKQYSNMCLSELYVSLGMLTSAEKLIKKAIKRYSGDRFPERIEGAYYNTALAHKYLADIYFFLGRYDDALTEIIAAEDVYPEERKSPDNPDVSDYYSIKAQHGAILSALGKHDGAEDALDRALQMGEEFFDDKFKMLELIEPREHRIIRALLMLGKPADAAELVERLDARSQRGVYYTALLAYYAGLDDAAREILISVKDTGREEAFAFSDKLFWLRFDILLAAVGHGNDAYKDSDVSARVRDICDARSTSIQYSDLCVGRAEKGIPLYPVYSLVFDALMRIGKVEYAGRVMSLMDAGGCHDLARANLAFKTADIASAAELCLGIARQQSEAAAALKFRLASVSAYLRAKDYTRAGEVAEAALEDARSVYRTEQSAQGGALLYASFVAVLRARLMLSELSSAESILSDELAMIDEARIDSEHLFVINHKRLLVYSLLESAARDEDKRRHYRTLKERLSDNLHEEYLARIERLLDNRRYSAALKLEKRAIATAKRFKEQRGDAYGYDRLCDTLTKIARCESSAAASNARDDSRSRELFWSCVSVRDEENRKLGTADSCYRLSVAAYNMADAEHFHSHTMRQRCINIAISTIKSARMKNDCTEYAFFAGKVYLFAATFCYSDDNEQRIRFCKDAISALINIDTVEAATLLFDCYYRMTEIDKKNEREYFALAYRLYEKYGGLRTYTIKVMEYVMINGLPDSTVQE